MLSVAVGGTYRQDRTSSRSERRSVSWCMAVACSDISPDCFSVQVGINYCARTDGRGSRARPTPPDCARAPPDAPDLPRRYADSRDLFIMWPEIDCRDFNKLSCVSACITDRRCFVIFYSLLFLKSYEDHFQKWFVFVYRLSVIDIEKRYWMWVVQCFKKFIWFLVFGVKLLNKIFTLKI